MGLEKAFEALGLAAEFTPAAAIYLVFLWLDRKSSDQAREAISSWTRGEQYRTLELGAPMVALFDRIYSYPLFRLRAFGRSAFVTSLIFIPWIIAIDWEGYVLSDPIFEIRWRGTLFLGTIVSDYISLFAVRAVLKIAAQHLLLSIILAAAVGIAIVLCIYHISFALSLVYNVYVLIPGIPVLKFIWIAVSNVSTFSAYFQLDHFLSMIPAVFVHLWLPLFAIGVLSVRVLQTYLYAVGRAQWFLREGSNHPIEAAGFIASILAFMGTGGYHLTRWWLG